MTATITPFIGRPGSLIARIRAAGGRYRVEHGEVRAAIIPRSSRSLWTDLVAAGWCVEAVEDYLSPADQERIKRGYAFEAARQWRARCRRPERRAATASVEAPGGTNTA